MTGQDRIGGQLAKPAQRASRLGGVLVDAVEEETRAPLAGVRVERDQCVAAERCLGRAGGTRNCPTCALGRATRPAYRERRGFRLRPRARRPRGRASTAGGHEIHVPAKASCAVVGTAVGGGNAGYLDRHRQDARERHCQRSPAVAARSQSAWAWVSMSPPGAFALPVTVTENVAKRAEISGALSRRCQSSGSESGDAVCAWSR
jgi:hypothetical protein